MLGTHVTHSLGDLRRDFNTIQRQVRPDCRKAVQRANNFGNEVAQGFARAKNPPGSHAWQYPSKFSAEMHRGGGLFGNVISGEFGPRHSGQGMLASILENGSRSGNAPQQNLARASDSAAEALRQYVHVLPPTWFWPGS